MANLKVRPLQDGDRHFVLDSWKKSERTNPAISWVPNEYYWASYPNRVWSILKRCDVSVAHPLADPDHLLGWLAYERINGCFVAHYCFVKAAFRRMGIAKELFVRSGRLPNDTIIATHWSEHCEPLQGRLGLLYRPSLIRGDGCRKTISVRERNSKPEPLNGPH